MERERMAESPRRRWPRFNLRFAFVLLTLSAVAVLGVTNWIERTAEFVRDRRAALESRWSHSPAAIGSSVNIPFAQRMMGDVAVERIIVGTWASDEDFHQAEQLFPEAEVSRNVPFWEDLIFRYVN